VRYTIDGEAMKTLICVRLPRTEPGGIVNVKTIVAILAVLMPGLAAAQINKCVDATGKTVGYAAECPAGTRAEQTGIKSRPASPGTEQKSLAERDADFRKRQIEKQEASAKAEKKSAETEQRKRACEDSQAYLKSLQARQRITKTDPKTGERTFLSDSEYPKEIARAERNIAAHCK
jgi:hypothetical protein